MQNLLMGKCTPDCCYNKDLFLTAVFCWQLWSLLLTLLFKDPGWRWNIYLGHNSQRRDKNSQRIGGNRQNSCWRSVLGCYLSNFWSHSLGQSPTSMWQESQFQQCTQQFAYKWRGIGAPGWHSPLGAQLLVSTQVIISRVMRSSRMPDSMLSA